MRLGSLQSCYPRIAEFKKTVMIKYKYRNIIPYYNVELRFTVIFALLAVLIICFKTVINMKIKMQFGNIILGGDFSVEGRCLPLDIV